MTPKFKSAVLIVALGLFWAAGATAQLTVLNSNVPAGFADAGYIQAATLDSSADPRSGGTLTMNGIRMIVPENTVVQFPANTLTWAQLFDHLVSTPVYDPGIPSELNLAIPAGTTGLALVDNPGQALGVSPYLPFNAIVEGNIDVANQSGRGVGAYIIGLILPMNQDLGNGGAGFITYIDYVRGRFEVGGILNTPGTGAVVEINDPTGRYGWAHSPDPRWSVDPDNPTVAAGDGFPMGIPKVAPPAIDADRPIYNRPLNPPLGAAGHDPFLQAGAPLTTFFMPAKTAPNAPGDTTPDPWKQVPFMVGDYVTYFGVLYKNNPNAPLNPTVPLNQQMYISANTVGADKLAFYTAPGTKPCYMSLERMVIGNGGAGISVPPNATLGIVGGFIPLPEPRRNITVTGFVTDSTRLVDIFAVDIDPATGAEKPRLLGTVLPEPGLAGGRGNKGRFRFVVGKGSFLPTTRVYMAKSHTGTVQLPKQVGNITPANGLLAGQYHAPMFTFQFPDAAPGFPIIPSNFNTMPFLVNGEGGNPSAGPLFPFPPFLP